MKDSICEAEARRWVKSLDGKWRLQVLSKRVRLSKDGTRKEIPARVRRFAEGIPWAFVKPALDYLLKTAPYSGKSLANGVDFDSEYRPTITLWQRDQQTGVAGARQAGDATYTLVQDLVEDTERDAYRVGSSSSCSETVVTDYVWDAADVEEIPQGGQGVTYAVAAVSRNEDGTFDYQVVERRALTQEHGWVVVRVDALAKVEEKLYDNVYTDDSGGYVDHEGNAIELPESGGGVLVRLENLRQNDDCTVAFAVVRETAVVPNTLRETSTENQFEEERGETVRDVAELGDASDAANGVVTSHDSRLQPDGSFENTVETKAEQPVEDAVVRVRVGRKGKWTTREDRNQQAPADTSDVQVGGTVEVKKTPGRLYDNSVTEYDKTEIVSGDLCEEDLFSHTDAATVGGVDMPEEDDHVEGAGVGGKTVSRRTDMDDDGGIVQTTTVKQEKNVPDAVVEQRVTNRGKRVTTTVRNASGPLPDLSAADVGKTIRNEKTPGGLYNTTESSVDLGEKVTSGATCEKTIFQHEHSETTAGGDNAVEEAEHVVDAGGGEIHSRRATMDEEGVVTVVETTTEEKNVPDAKITERFTTAGVIRTVTDMHGLDSSHDVQEIGETVEVQQTDGGLHNRTYTELPSFSDKELAKSKQTTALTEINETVTLKKTGEASATPTGDHDILLEKTSTTEAGAKTCTTETRTPKPFLKSYSWESYNTTASSETKYLETLIIFRNQEDMPEVPHGRVSVSMSVNEYGLLDGQIHVSRYISTASTSGSDFGMTYSSQKKVHSAAVAGGIATVPFTIYVNDKGSFSAGFLGSNDTHDHPALGLHSSDNGRYGIKYGDGNYTFAGSTSRSAEQR